MKKIYSFVQVITLLGLAVIMVGCGGRGSKKSQSEDKKGKETPEEKIVFRMEEDRPLNLLSDYAPAASDSISMFDVLMKAREEQEVEVITPHMTENTKIIYVEKIVGLNFTEFHDGIAFVQNGKTKQWAMIDRAGNQLTDFDIVMRAYSGPEEIFRFYNGVMPYSGSLIQEGGTILMDKNLRFIKHLPDMTYCGNFVGGVASGFLLVPNPDSNKPGHKAFRSKSVYINTQGDFVFPEISMLLPEHSMYGGENALRALKDGRAAYFDYERARWGFIDAWGNISIPATFKKVQDFSEGLAAVMDMDDKWWFIDTNGEIVIHTPFLYEPKPFQEGLAIVRKRGTSSSDIKYAYIDKTGQIVYDDMFESTPFFAGKAKVRANIPESKYGGWETIELNRDLETYQIPPVTNQYWPNFYDSGLRYAHQYIILDENRDIVMRGCRTHFREGLSQCSYFYQTEEMSSGKHAYGFMNIKGEIEILFMEPMF